MKSGTSSTQPGAARLARSPDVVHRELDDGAETVLLDLETGEYHGLNRLGSLIWALLERPGTREELVARVRARMGEAPAQLDDDVARFLQKLLHRRLLVRVEG